MLGNAVGLLSSSLDQASTTRKYGHLDIRERIIDTGGRTIRIDEIATISVLEDDAAERRMRLYVTAALSAVTVIGLPLTIIVLIMAYFIKPKYALVIGTSDGSRSLFESRTLPILHEVKDYLTEKINANDERRGRPFYIDNSRQETNIDKYVAGDDHSIAVHGDRNQIAAHSPGARLSAREIDNRVDNSMRVENSPGAQVGYGHVAQGNRTTTLTRVDYSQVIADVVTLRDYYAEDPGAKAIAARLDELERLMREGTPSPASKIRARDIAVDLSTIMASTPQWAQFFSHIARMIGM
ncbi:MAG: DUF6232 family protein [Hyphomicrobiaceae bacterium]|nr:DUF6232 family protein [Hyphomicrobiaceae bacterium]